MARDSRGPERWTAAQWKAVKSPHCVHLLAALEALGEATASELAALTGRSRQSVYPHLAQMVQAGIVGAGSRAGPGRKVAVFRFLPEVLAGSVDPSTGRGLLEAAKVSGKALGEAEARCRRWGLVADGRPIDLSQNPEALTSVRITWLDNRLRARLNRLLRRVGSVLAEGALRRTGRRTCVIIYHFPDFTAAESRRARGAARPSRA